LKEYVPPRPVFYTPAKPRAGIAPKRPAMLQHSAGSLQLRCGAHNILSTTECLPCSAYGHGCTPSLVPVWCLQAPWGISTTQQGHVYASACWYSCATHTIPTRAPMPFVDRFYRKHAALRGIRSMPQAVHGPTQLQRCSKSKQPVHNMCEVRGTRTCCEFMVPMILPQPPGHV